jgi:hypothetical protein
MSRALRVLFGVSGEAGDVPRKEAVTAVVVSAQAGAAYDRIRWAPRALLREADVTLTGSPAGVGFGTSGGFCG